MYRVRTAADSRLQRLVGPAARDDGGGPGLDFRSSRTGRGGGSGFPVQLSARGEGQVQGGDGVVEVMGLGRFDDRCAHRWLGHSSGTRDPGKWYGTFVGAG